MIRCRQFAAALLTSLMFALPALAEKDQAAPTLTTPQLLAKSTSDEWRKPNPENLVVMQLANGRVLIELAPDFTPLHAANIRTLIRQHYFDGLAIVRVQDNFVTQWDDPAGDDNGDKSKMHPLGKAKATVPPEFTRPIDAKLPWTRLPDGDVYAAEVGFSEGFPVARDPASGQEWLTHCYGMVGVGRDNGADTGNGSALYAVIGQAPRRLDRNLAVIGRVLDGMPLLSSLPRGTGPMGFYDKPSQQVAIQSVQLAADLPAAQRPSIEVLRTDSKTFAALVDAKRNRRDAFYTVPAGKIDICSIDVPMRAIPTAAATRH
ncbi:peptidylprolyl isomerase [Rhodanobacter sp. ANJX3]|uniref:peptidylprolyl isomerase n=1 Tax=unclassified Rhodanobacter TaxID=2621553 RepID=UPI0015CC0C3D|nr:MULTISPECIES: peptidylprolyl isomerase [unclassified Rhodanobacter]MBB5358007.1 peptidylprolyl isomerase [Rhodanobacter sp. ANJX3]NYE29725.1 peptidylprolyl isomerase [Rhodanobacter sp. K2T2]